MTTNEDWMQGFWLGDRVADPRFAPKLDPLDPAEVSEALEKWGSVTPEWSVEVGDA